MGEPHARCHVAVTGGSRGLGLAMVGHLLDRGYRVSCCSRAMSDELRGLQQRFAGSLFFEACDIGETGAAERFIASAMDASEGKPLWALVNNAGIAREGVLATFPNVDIDAVLKVNLHGAIYMARAAARVFLKQLGPGRIVNISSIVGGNGYTGLAAYSASKAGLDGLTRSLARELGPRGITVNAIAPGYFDTDMSGTLSDSKRSQIVRRTPLGRFCAVEDILPLLDYLLSEGSAFMTGQVLTLDGGMNC